MRIDNSFQPGLLEWAKIFAGLVFKDKADHEWLERKFAMYNDIISESWVIQEAVQKGRREELTRLILKLVQGRYPETNWSSYRNRVIRKPA